MRTSIIVFFLLFIGFAQNDYCLIDTISLQGSATISVKPDIVKLKIGLSSEAPTSAEALSKLNDQVNKVITSLKALQFPPSNYSTQSININRMPNLNNFYMMAAQNIDLIIGDPTSVNKIVSSLTLVANISIISFTQDISNQQLVYSQARKAAFNEAKSKLDDYLSLTQQSSSGILKIIDISPDSYFPYQRIVDIPTLKLESTVLAPKLFITANVLTIWSIKN